MAIQAGDFLPDVMVKCITADGITDMSTKALCAGGLVVIFAVPGAFTPECSARHLPGFMKAAEDFKAKGVSAIVCVAVNDPFVMQAWANKKRAAGRVVMLADGNGDFTRATGLALDASAWGMGLRSQRYAMIVRDGVVTQMFVEEPGAFEVSAASHVLAHLA